MTEKQKEILSCKEYRELFPEVKVSCCDICHQNEKNRIKNLIRSDHYDKEFLICCSLAWREALKMEGHWVFYSYEFNPSLQTVELKVVCPKCKLQRRSNLSIYFLYEYSGSLFDVQRLLEEQAFRELESKACSGIPFCIRSFADAVYPVIGIPHKTSYGPEKHETNG